MGDSVQQIKDKLNILDVISPYVELHKAGKNFKGKSPFAAEKTPSFYVSPDRGMYYCFSTSQGGDMFTFIQVMEGVDFKESLKILAQKAGVELVPEDPTKRTERERWYLALSAATNFYTESLAKESQALEYLAKRGVSNETIQKWQIGFAPGPPKHGWREVKEHLEARGFSRSELLKTGLIKTTEGGKEPFDVFRDRIMFPMSDTSGKVVAFSGRILSKDTDAPKYVNSPETELYKKSELLYGYDKAKHGIRNLDFSLIVEGQFDVVMSHQAGYSNAVAVSGTALTVHHVQLLERLSKRVVLALDADRAGIAAMKRAADLMLRRGLDVKVAELPEGKDPADLILIGKEQFKAVIGKSVHVIEFLLHVLTRTITDARALKLKAREEILPFILLLPNRIDQEHFVDIVAKAIGTTSDAIRFELERLRDESKSSPTSNSNIENINSNKAPAEKGDLLRNARLFLEATISISEQHVAEFLKKEISELLGGEVELLPESEVAGVTFNLEQQFANMPELAVQEEIVARLNNFKKGIIRQRLNTERQLLESIEEGGDTGPIMEMIRAHENKMKEAPYTVAVLTEKTKKTS